MAVAHLAVGFLGLDQLPMRLVPQHGLNEAIEREDVVVAAAPLRLAGVLHVGRLRVRVERHAVLVVGDEVFERGDVAALIAGQGIALGDNGEEEPPSLRTISAASSALNRLGTCSNTCDA